MPDFGKIMGDRFGECIKVMSAESDRGAIVLGAALLDEGLHDLLAARMAPPVEPEDEILDGYRSPCSSFGARIDLGYRLGAMGLETRASLHLIRKMRNDAAHASSHRDLSSPELLNRLRELCRLNQDLLTYMWGSVEQAVRDGRIRSLPSSPSPELPDVVGWRGTWDLLVSMLAAGLATVPHTLPQISPLAGPRLKSGGA
jgi:hypothetical protein